MFNLFGKQPTLKETQRENEKTLRKAGRELDREQLQLEREEKKLTQEIKRLAKQNDKEGCAILAKQLVQLRKQKARTYTAKGKISSIGVHTKAMGANVKLAEVMGTSAQTMRQMNTIMKPEKVQADLVNFQREATKMAMTDEMVNDTLDDILADSGDEEESDRIVSQVLDEIGIEISGKMADAPSTHNIELGERSKSKLTDKELEEQLAKLKT